jgi:hypothetical protein
MKETALRNARKITDPAQRLNQVREYLQAMVLRSMHEAGQGRRRGRSRGTLSEWFFQQSVTRAAPAAGVLYEDTALLQKLDIPERCII